MTDKLLKSLILMPFIWMFSGALLLRNGDKLMVVAVVISIVATLFYSGVASVKKNINEQGLWIVLAVTGYAVFSYLYHGASSREMRALVGGGLLLLTFPRELIHTRILKYLIILGSAFLLVSSYYFSHGNWSINRIPHGTMGAAITVLALVFVMNAQSYRDKMILTLALIMSVFGLVMNPTRGIWLALLITIIIILLPKLKAQLFDWRYVAIAIIVLSFGIYIAKPKLEDRLIKATQVEVTNIQDGNLNNSIGIRLQLWMAAPKIISENLILGSGDRHQFLLKELWLKGEVTKIVTGFSHYHNQLLDRLVKGGIVGLTLLLSVFIYPLFTASPGINRQMAIAVVTVYAVAGLTDVPLNHGAPLFMYLLLMFTLKKNNEASC